MSDSKSAKKPDPAAKFSGPATAAAPAQTKGKAKASTKTPATKDTNKVAEAAQKRAATNAAKREARIKERGYSLPLVLTCQVTKKEVKYTSPSYIDKRIAKAGSLEKLQNTFVSREGRQQEKAAQEATKASA